MQCTSPQNECETQPVINENMQYTSNSEPEPKGDQDSQEQSEAERMQSISTPKPKEDKGSQAPPGPVNKDEVSFNLHCH